MAEFQTPEERAPLIKNMLSELKTLPAPGLRVVKNAELYNKWRPLLPPQFRDITCSHPGDDVLKRVKEQQKQKKKGALVKKPKLTKKCHQSAHSLKQQESY